MGDYSPTLVLVAINKSKFEECFIPEPTTGCWLWINGNAKATYGAYRDSGKNYRAHRASWLLYCGEIPKGLYVCHKCDTPACVNPKHLFLGTQKDNIHDMIKKGRNKKAYRPLKSHCKSGHEFNSQNTHYNRKTKARVCRKCLSIRAKLAILKHNKAIGR
jgi:hypothetical protein